MTLYAPDEPTVVLAPLEPEPARPSTARVLGRVFDWLGISVMALLVCIFICQQGFGAFHLVQTAAEAPFTIVKAATATTDGQGYIERTEWTNVGQQASLRVYPTQAGRQASVGFVSADVAWAQVVAMTPDADAPGMKEQFVCHWRFAELGAPGKTSWNLEPWRPVVSGAEMIESRCNPGGAEESF
jgi:hypothetical protein